MKYDKKKMTDRELSNFCNQMAMILTSGISLSEGLDMMLEDFQSDHEKELLLSLKEHVEQSGIFSNALEQSGFFPSYMVQMVHIGEQTGHLDDVMQSLSAHYDRTDAVRQSIRSAVFYPAMMFGLMCVIVLILLTNVMPIFNQVFLQLGTELSGVSKLLLELGQSIKNSALILTLIALILMVCGICIAFIPKWKEHFLRTVTRWSVIRKLYDCLFLFRFSSGMMLALSSGMAPEESIDLVKELSHNDTYSQKKLSLCKEKMDDGEEFCQAMCSSRILTGVYGRMALIGEKTGTIDLVMERIAQDTQEDFTQKISHILGLIEPSLVAVLSVTVGIILMSVMFPLLGILSGM